MHGKRIGSLECLRGCAALVVVAWHLLIGFAPLESGQFQTSVPDPIIGRLWFALFNGSAAVTFFFVLSGFVLPWSYYHSGDTRLVAHSLLKRWPRLAGACMVATVFSWALFKIGAYHFTQAGTLTGSPWLADFGYAGLPSGFSPSFWPSLAQGAWRTFFDGQSNLDSSLWTMRPEIVGSLAVLGAAPLLYYVRSTYIAIGAAIVISGLMYHAEEHIPQFLAGALLG